MNASRNDRWNGYYYVFGDGERCVVTFNATACDPAHQKPSFGRRIIGFSPPEDVSPEGMPSPAAFARLKAIEDRAAALVSERGIPAWLVGKQVYRGMRELVFQVDARGVAAFDAMAAQLEVELGGTELVPYEGWSFFNDRIAPDADARAHIANREVLAALKSHGTDLGRPHVIDHTFVGSMSALGAVRRRLLDAGFVESGSSTTHLTLSTTDLLDQDTIDALTANLRRLAEQSGASYDGWGAAIARS